MLFKSAALFLIAATTAAAATTHSEKAGQNQTEWVFDNGSNKGYVCPLMKPNAGGFDVYVPALWPDPSQKAANALTALPWLHFANQRDANDAIGAYCPTKATAALLD